MPDAYLLQLPVGGVNQSVDSAMLDFNQVVDAVNVQIKDAKMACRPGVRVHKLDISGNFQGACFHDPSRGMSQQQFSSNPPGIVARIGGLHYVIRPGSKRHSAPTVTPLDTTPATASNPDYHLAFMKQCENYVISQDGHGATWIWDGSSPPRFSPGYNSVDKEESRLANGASALDYAHGRIVQVVNGRQIIVGDIIHKTELSQPSNILETTEQTYWATGSFFSPPSDTGPVTAIESLPLRDTAHGHGDTMIHSYDGIFSLDLTKYPRSTWANEAIARHVLLDTGAAGFYAITIYDGDQFFLSRHGLQTLRSARAESTLLGNPFQPISVQVRNYVDPDTRNYFKYASVNKFLERRRLFMTTSHVILDSSNRGGRGVLVLNFLPITGGQSAWEGLWTLPSECGVINQLVNGTFDSDERLFAFTTNDDGEVFLVEFTVDDPDDTLSDGTTQRIEWQVLTREAAHGEAAERKTTERAQMTIRNVSGVLEWETYARSDESTWETWHSGCSDGTMPCLEKTPVRDLLIKLGSPPQNVKTGTRFQMLLKFRGCGSLEAVKLRQSFDQAANATPSPEGECVVLRQEYPSGIHYDPFEYSKP